MARISTYSLDTSVNGHDRLIGTDGGRLADDGTIIAGTAGATKNFTLTQLRDFFAGTGAAHNLQVGEIPVQGANDMFIASSLSQNTDGDIIVQNNLMIGGDLLDMNGDPFLTMNPDGGVDITGTNELEYNTAASDGSMVQIIEPYSVIAITQAGMYRLPEPTDGMWVKIVKIDGSGNSILLPHNGGDFRVMNQTLENPDRMIVLNVREVSFELVHIGNPTDASRVGWVFVGAN